MFSSFFLFTNFASSMNSFQKRWGDYDERIFSLGWVGSCCGGLKTAWTKNPIWALDLI